MIAITRSLARQLRAVFRRLVSRQSGMPATVSFHADANGLRARLHGYEVSAEYSAGGTFPADEIGVAFELLADVEGKDDSPVHLEAAGKEAVQARWNDAGIPMVKTFTRTDLAKLTPFPVAPQTFSSNPPELLQALDAAMHCAAQGSASYTTEKVQLRGTGAIVGTDGRQLLWQEGFQFPWTGDVLIPSVKVFNSKEIPHELPVAIGKTASHVTISVGTWTFFFAADTESRYPKVEQIIPVPDQATGSVRLDPDDAAFLANALPRLLRGDEGVACITMDLHGQVVFRAKASEQANINELVLTRSQASGKPVAVSLNREHLARALGLGLTQMYIFATESPVLCQDERRRYVTVPVSKESIIRLSTNALRAYSSPENIPDPQPERINPVMTQAQANGVEHTNGSTAYETNGANGAAPHPLIEEAQAIRTMLRAAMSGPAS